MKYPAGKLDNLIHNFNQFSVIVLHGKNEGNLHNDFQELIDKIAGVSANEEMRLSTFYDNEIKDKLNEILFKVESKGFFKGPSLLIIKDLSEKNEKIILDIDKIWQDGDSLTLVCVDKLSKNSKLKALAEKSARIAYLRYYDSSLDKKQLLTLLDEKNLVLKNEYTLDTLYDFAKNSSKSELLYTLEKLSLLKFNDNSPVEIEDIVSTACLGYETDDLKFAFAVAGKKLNEIYNNLKHIQISGKSPESTIQFLNLYFRKLYLISIYGVSSIKAKREYPFLFGRDEQMAIKFAKNWGKKKLQETINSLIIAELDLRKTDPAYRFMLFTKHIIKIGNT